MVPRSGTDDWQHHQGGAGAVRFGGRKGTEIVVGGGEISDQERMKKDEKVKEGRQLEAPASTTTAWPRLRVSGRDRTADKRGLLLIWIMKREVLF